jgi:hypothetical protein
MRIELRAALAAPIGLALFAFVLVALAFVVPGSSSKVAFGLFAIGVLGIAIQLARRRLVIDDTGLTARGMFGTQQMSWGQIDHYTFWSMDQQMVYAVGAGGVGGAIIVGLVAAAMAASRKRGNANRRFATGKLTLVGKGSVPIDARYANVTAALDPIFERLHGLLGPRRDFAPFTLGATELAHAKKGPIALAEIEKISVAGGSLVIKKRGKRLAWLRVHMKQIHNSLLLIEALGEAGLIVDAAAGMFVPPTVLDKLHAATQRQQAMPTARVVRRD